MIGRSTISIHQATHQEYRAAAALLWGDAGGWAVDEFARHNGTYFAGELPPLPIVIGLTAYGHCTGLTRSGSGRPSRITLASQEFQNLAAVSDTILHEMVHAVLFQRGASPDHNDEPWCVEITRISALLGQEISARPVKVRRVPNPAYVPGGSTDKTIVTRRPAPGVMPRTGLARWPHSIRPEGYGIDAGALTVDTY